MNPKKEIIKRQGEFTYGKTTSRQMGSYPRYRADPVCIDFHALFLFQQG